ncbi:hypothetical protein BAAM0499_03200 [Bifidobacterium animalis subsp. animalis MCC 0499]|uniref:Panacea domain-containing protein n=1 Tax=Bifidobacterium animalis TaxID=28025 RepID=UPI00069BC4B3|nr:type II toxin-antitoxin system antitoxin SocA domain-containing protein [Bifidobacterium animalis]KOA60898.1 hypothetical protein BAAM0499_03200 [Bifidobacterium animalis subsp. animalis MCC 0499]
MKESNRDEEKLTGVGISPELVANNILRRAFAQHIPVSPMKLQKLLFFVTCVFQRNTGVRLLTESFQPWKYGPVCGSVYAEFRSFGGDPITRYAQDAVGGVYVADEEASPELAKALNLVWENLKGYSAVALSRITHRPGSAWSKATLEGDSFISNTAMSKDHTFDKELGMS